MGLADIIADKLYKGGYASISVSPMGGYSLTLQTRAGCTTIEIDSVRTADMIIADDNYRDYRSEV
jgi:hypothetical protein